MNSYKARRRKRHHALEEISLSLDKNDTRKEECQSEPGAEHFCAGIQEGSAEPSSSPSVFGGPLVQCSRSDSLKLVLSLFTVPCDVNPVKNK